MKRRLGDLLREAGWVTGQQLDEALRHHAKAGVPLGEACMQLQLLSDEHLHQAIAYQHDLPYVDLDRTPPTEEAFAAVPEYLLRKHQIVPVKIERNGKLATLLIATSNPRTFSALDEIAFAAGMRVKLAVAALHAARRALARLDEVVISPDEEFIIERSLAD